MRTFPNVWVPPGGGIELGESLQETGLRELFEEVGLSLQKSDIVEEAPLCLWESVYPQTLKRGKPVISHGLRTTNCLIIYKFKMQEQNTRPRQLENASSQMYNFFPPMFRPSDPSSHRPLPSSSCPSRPSATLLTHCSRSQRDGRVHVGLEGHGPNGRRTKFTSQNISCSLRAGYRECQKTYISSFD
jgi:hypothetical protein